MRGSVNLVVGSTLSSTVAMIALCELVASERFKTGDKIYSLFPKKDSVYRSLPQKTLSVILERYLSNEESVQRRLSAILEGNEDPIRQETEFSISDVMGVGILNGNINYERYRGARDVFIFAPLDISWAMIYSKESEWAEQSGMNIWIMSNERALPYEAEELIADNCSFFKSSYCGFIDDQYSVRVRVLDSKLVEMYSNIVLLV